MDIRRAAEVPVTVEHEGTCHSYFMFDKESVRDETIGTYLEFICEFELAAGQSLAPHDHDSHEFYYLIRGSAVMTIDGEDRPVGVGDLVHIPPNAVHSITDTSVSGAEGMRALAFAVMRP
jgi:quercetin dioxygenase-like cupin family protein